MRLFFFQGEDGIRDSSVTGVQTCALPIWPRRLRGVDQGSRQVQGSDPYQAPARSRRRNAGAPDCPGGREGAARSLSDRRENLAGSLGTVKRVQTPYTRASRIRLNGVSVARRKRVRPPLLATS